jgi:hypothetical protein
VCFYFSLLLACLLDERAFIKLTFSILFLSLLVLFGVKHHDELKSIFLLKQYFAFKIEQKWRFVLLSHDRTLTE